MAIDMIEQCELPAASIYAQGCSYRTQFDTDNIDLVRRTDGSYAAATGISLMGNLIELNKSKKQFAAEKGVTQAMAEVNKKFPIPVKNCQAIKEAREKIRNEIIDINNKIVAGTSANTQKNYLNALSSRDLILKNMQLDLKCEEMESEAELEKSKQDVLRALSEAGGEEVAQSTFDKFSKYFLIGVAGVVVIGAMIIMFRKKKSA